MKIDEFLMEKTGKQRVDDELRTTITRGPRDIAGDYLSWRRRSPTPRFSLPPAENNILPWPVNDSSKYQLYFVDIKN